MRVITHPQPELMNLPQIFQALADPIRLEIVQRLTITGPLTCGQLNGGRPKSSMSHHYKILRDAGLLHTEVVGKEHYNSLRMADIQAVCPGLLEVVTRATLPAL